MAELMLKVDNNSLRWREGDIVEAFSDFRISRVYANMICHVRKSGFTFYGLRPVGSLSQVWLDNVYQYRFHRVSRTEVLRVHLDTGERKLFGRTHIAVPQYIANRLRHSRHRIFGVPGAEFWHGGHKRYVEHKLQRIWGAIEERTNYRQEDFTRWPMGRIEQHHFAWVSVEGLTREHEVDVLRKLELPHGGTISRFMVPWREVVPGRIILQKNNRDYRDEVVLSLNDIVEKERWLQAA